MSPLNRRSPDQSDAAGLFGWDVLPGYYQVSAQHQGCTAPSGGSIVDSGIYAVPPPVTGLVLKLRCPQATFEARTSAGRVQVQYLGDGYNAPSSGKAPA